jgi:hypothetical protein
MVPELDASEDDSSDDACSGHEEMAESEDEQGVTPVVIETDNGRRVPYKAQKTVVSDVQSCQGDTFQFRADLRVPDFL